VWKILERLGSAFEGQSHGVARFAANKQQHFVTSRAKSDYLITQVDGFHSQDSRKNQLRLRPHPPPFSVNEILSDPSARFLRSCERAGNDDLKLIPVSLPEPQLFLFSCHIIAGIVVV
jgi:hypothetical protein